MRQQPLCQRRKIIIACYIAYLSPQVNSVEEALKRLNRVTFYDHFNDFIVCHCCRRNGFGGGVIQSKGRKSK